MALENSVNEANWVFQSASNEADGYSSTFQRRDPEPDENGNAVYTTKSLTVSFIDIIQEYKYFALTNAAAVGYIAAHPELNLTASRVNQVGDGCTLTKRTYTRTITGYTLADVPETV